MDNDCSNLFSEVKHIYPKMNNNFIYIKILIPLDGFAFTHLIFIYFQSLFLNEVTNIFNDTWYNS